MDVRLGVFARVWTTPADGTAVSMLAYFRFIVLSDKLCWLERASLPNAMCMEFR